MLSAVTADGIALNLPFIDLFKNDLATLNYTQNVIDKYVTSMKRVTDNVMKERDFVSYSHFPKPGVIYYNPSIFSLAYLHNLLLNSKNAISCDKLNEMLKAQISLFPDNCRTFNYRNLDHNNDFNEPEFAKYFNNDLENFFLAATYSQKSTHRKHNSPDHDLRQMLCIRMAIAILCLALNRKSVFMQTLVGLVAFAHGLSDLGFDVLNMLGCCCSADHIRRRGSFWAKKGKCSDELMCDNVNFWRASFDNLNYKMKYAKKLCTRGPKNVELNHCSS